MKSTSKGAFYKEQQRRYGARNSCSQVLKAHLYSLKGNANLNAGNM
ncbi:hypothetical protein [Pontibacter akesuensis]|uniref:Uncharacterized protein n=1 Tax=Pontibacter akesuensis TaxID=388950 RepID=A0A1I7GKM5_9BACT|nr:hypothetical protein [Pontibacter akesuensis]SFU48806.1 hypothetical protein SAMN04487941_1082 [Pontibacter akesuensis]